MVIFMETKGGGGIQKNWRRRGEETNSNSGFKNISPPHILYDQSLINKQFYHEFEKIRMFIHVTRAHLHIFKTKLAKKKLSSAEKTNSH